MCLEYATIDGFDDSRRLVEVHLEGLCFLDRLRLLATVLHLRPIVFVFTLITHDLCDNLLEGGVVRSTEPLGRFDELARGQTAELAQCELIALNACLAEQQVRLADCLDLDRNLALGVPFVDFVQLIRPRLHQLAEAILETQVLITSPAHLLER